jgi:hypothetical protein
MICPWCDGDYPVEFFGIHHRNHIHNDDRPENQILICAKCHQRHHKESGYDTIIIKKDEYKPKTMEELMIDIDREEFLKSYRTHQAISFGRNLDIQKDPLSAWIKEGCSKPFIGKSDEWHENIIKK